MSNSGVGFSSSNNGLGCTQPTTHTHGDRSLFRLGDALLETAISVTCVRVGHANTEQEYDSAFAELEERRSQREFTHVAFSAEDIRANLRASIDNQIQDLLHERMDAERSCGGASLDEFLSGQK
jgi:hypothetical protein